ncbi:hypothetical protein POX_b02075 [Penicillium oxalicum]|uniref:hypothetical protein n=1 Tax=Penicillium oxalicum TaxID=69781 RepID=UPI0020B6629B|nr:hypothetical protein POX_b02075 [Penicillium oxalicum]KAI2792042.1 hypothetical protein POX_b02075 [Penicillium oxalicum]
MLNTRLTSSVGIESNFTTFEANSDLWQHFRISYQIPVLLLLSLLFYVQIKSRTSPESRPPCERVIEQAERTNRKNGHENAGFLSKEAGFAPLKTITALPPSHHVWDQLSVDLPRLVQNQTVREAVTQMPVLDASAKALPDIYLQRAATILGMTAHVFVRMQGSEPLTLKYDDHSNILPPSLLKPWTTVCKRLGRDKPALTYVDGVVANFTSTGAPSPSEVTLDNLQLLVPTVGTIEERTFVGIMIEINAKTVPILHEIIQAQRCVLAKDSDSLKATLRHLHQQIKQVTRILTKLNANRSFKDHINPILWTLTVANLGIPWVRGAVGAAGTAHPFFHMMDEFTGRSDYNTGIGKEAQIVRASYPIHWRQFLEAVKQVSVSQYVKASNDEDLKRLWQTVTSSYFGNDGLLGFHRRKVFGFLAVSFRIGRSTTINGLGRRRRAEPWQEADQELENARLERDRSDQTESEVKFDPSSNQIYTSQLITHNSKEAGFWFAANGAVYDASPFMQKHPGGDIVIDLCSGQDITDSLVAVGHLTNPTTRNILEKYRIGKLARPRLTSPEENELYLAAVDLGKKAAEMENVHRANFQILNGKLTNLDEPGILTPKKARHLHDAKKRLRSEHLPALASLVALVLDSLAELNIKLDLFSARTRIQTLLGSDSMSGETVMLSNYQAAVATLRADLADLVGVKEHTSSLLATLEDSESGIHHPRWTKGVADSLNEIVNHLVKLA